MIWLPVLYQAYGNKYLKFEYNLVKARRSIDLIVIKIPYLVQFHSYQVKTFDFSLLQANGDDNHTF